MREIKQVKLADTRVSIANVRNSQAVGGVEGLAHDIDKNGQISPCLVRMEKGKHAVFVGQRRREALLLLSKDKPDTTMDVVVMDIDEKAAKAISLSENTQREEMQPVDCWKAYSAFYKNGWATKDIAIHFGVKEIDVKRMIALGSSEPSILKAFENNDIDLDALKILAIASKDAQKRFKKAYKDGDYPSNGFNTRRFCKDDEKINAEYALFDYKKLDLASSEDLFENILYIVDVEKFWVEQQKAIDSKTAEFEEAGYTVVRDDSLHSYNLRDYPKAEGGRVYVAVRESGEVEFMVDKILEKEYERINKAKLDIKSEGLEKPEKNETSLKMDEYIGCYRLNAMRSELMTNPKLATRLFVAQVISGDSAFNLKMDNASDRIKRDITGNKIDEPVKAAAYQSVINDVLKTLKLDKFCWQSESYQFENNDVVEAVMKADESTINNAFCYLVGLGLQYETSYSSVTRAANKSLKPDMSDYWKPDHSAFFDCLTNKDHVSNIAKKHFKTFSADGKLSELKAELAKVAASQKTFLPLYFAGGHYGSGKGLSKYQ